MLDNVVDADLPGACSFLYVKISFWKISNVAILTPPFAKGGVDPYGKSRYNSEREFLPSKFFLYVLI